MIDDKKTAKYVSEVLLKCGADLNESISYVQANCSDEEFKAYRDAAGKIMAEISFEGLNPVFQQHPDLKPEGLKYPLEPIDADGNAITVGDSVLFKKAPESLISGLPLEDQEAIKAQEGKTMEIAGFNSYGHAEMEFTAENGTMHTIWVEPADLFKV